MPDPPIPRATTRENPASPSRGTPSPSASPSRHWTGNPAKASAIPPRSRGASSCQLLFLPCFAMGAFYPVPCSPGARPLAMEPVSLRGRRRVRSVGHVEPKEAIERCDVWCVG